MSTHTHEPPPLLPAAEPRRGAAIASLILGFLGFVSAGVLGLAGLIVGILALRKTAKSPATHGGRGLAFGGIAAGAASVLLWGSVLAAIVIPSLRHARLVANETGALHGLQTLHMAQVAHQADLGKFAASLEELAPPSPQRPNGAGLIPADLAAGVRNGYRFTLTGSRDAYTISARPLEYGSTGRRSFFSDQSTLVRENSGAAPATAASPVIQ